ncbi:MAG: Ig-like domain-containing protein, partial [Lachnospiraceae bacterium]|nr:Ig-like domain-containing protein [Lachnospiraceae bacterium]
MASGYVKVATITRDQGDPATTDPSSDPESSPAPSTEPAESPSPDPNPEPAESPSPDPSPEPSPEPSTNPDPTPSASPSESPSPSPSVSPSADVTVTVSKTSLALKVAGTETLTATVKNGDGTTRTGATVTWSSSDSTIATVDATGKVTAVKIGTCNIIATSEGKTA